MKQLTIFTPTYNRADCIEELYKSLCEQTRNDFVWFVVDDGSTDDTSEIIKKFTVEGLINITYIYQSNQGKHVAYNTAIGACNTPLFTCVDSDDTLVPDAVEQILSNHEKYNEEDLLGYLYYKKNIGDKESSHQQFPIDVDRIGLMDLFHKYNYRSETMIVFYTDRIRTSKFPVFENEKFVTERVLYNQLNHIAPMRLCRSELYLFEYRQDGYSHNWKSLIAKNPYGYAFDYMTEADASCGAMNKAKLFAQYSAICKVYNLNKDVFDKKVQLKVIDTLISKALMPHYIKLFSNLRKRYE